MLMIPFYKNLELKEFGLESTKYMKYIEQFHNTLKMNIKYSTIKNSDLKLCESATEFIVALYTKPKVNFTLKLKQITGWKGYLEFTYGEEYIEPTEEVNKILALMMEIPSLVTKVKRMKSVAEQLYQVVKTGALILEEELVFKMDSLEGFIEKALKELEDIGLNVLYDNEQNTIIVPFGNMVMREFSTKEIILMTSTVLSVFKFLYALNACGDDFIKSMNLRGDFERWKNTRQKEVHDVFNRIKE